MSNATNEPRNPGNKRRRRSRGGQNRRDQHQHGGQSSHRNEQAPRAEEFRPQSGERKSRRLPPPAKLSWWQKLLKAIGLHKEPVRPQRKRVEPTPRAPKSNVRNARSGEGRPSDAAETRSEPRERKGRGRGERPQREPREQRGGDSSTVESSRVYVGNLSYDVSEQDLQELFRGVGPVRSVEVVYNRSTHRSKGYGFVEMINIDEARQAVTTLHDQFFMGRKMTVSGAKSKGQDDRDEPNEREEPRPVVVAATNPRASTEATAAVEPSTEPTPENPSAESVETPAMETPAAETPAAETPQAETPAVADVEPVEETPAPTSETASAGDSENQEERPA